MTISRQVFEFARIILPELFSLGVELFERHKGDAAAAAREITRIRDHGKKLRDVDAANRAELDELEKK
jgi:hypothetical protein